MAGKHGLNMHITTTEGGNQAIFWVHFFKGGGVGQKQIFCERQIEFKKL